MKVFKKRLLKTDNSNAQVVTMNEKKPEAVILEYNIATKFVEGFDKMSAERDKSSIKKVIHKLFNDLCSSTKAFTKDSYLITVSVANHFIQQRDVYFRVKVSAAINDSSIRLTSQLSDLEDNLQRLDKELKISITNIAEEIVL